MYNEFAQVYDCLIKSDINYDRLVDYIENLFHKYGKNPNLVCELAAGTGNVTIPMSNRGYDMIAVDSSFEMLEVARGKAEDKQILFLNQDMTKLDLYGTCDAFLCMIDGFNYITNKKSLFEIFKRIRTCFIENDGIFIFDISSKYKLKNILGNNTYIYDTDELFYSWENKYKSGICKMELNFFRKNSKGSFDRFIEKQIQRAYDAEEITKLLLDAGFSKVDVYGAFDFNPPKSDDERIVFAALA